MDNRALILCVDDEPVNLTIMEELLQEHYQLGTAKSGRECLQQVGEQIPDLILLDVNMPEVDGLETCRRLKADTATADIPIIFVSALASQEELMAGYEAGGDDYITKPFSDEILQKKIKVVLAGQRRKRELEKISDQAVEALQDTLSSSEALGMVVRFLHQSHAVQTLEELAASVFECLRKFELDSSLLIVAEPKNRVWFSDDINRPMESQILESLRDQDRVVSFATRLALSSDNATILVRNLPREDDREQRLREYLSILIQGLDDRLRGMQSRRLLDERRTALAEMLDGIRARLAETETLRARQQTKSSEILTTMESELDRLLLRLDLTREHKAGLLKIVERAASKIEAVIAEGTESHAELDASLDDFSAALDNTE